MISYYPQHSAVGSTHGSINTLYYNSCSYADVIPQFSGRLGVIKWYSIGNAKDQTSLQLDIQHLIKNTDHIVIFSNEEFWPTLPESRLRCHMVLDLLQDHSYSILYHCGAHDRIKQLGVHSTWQPWFCRGPADVYNYEYTPSDYDFACLLGRRTAMRDKIAPVMSEYNCLLNYAGRDHTTIGPYELKGSYNNDSYVNGMHTDIEFTGEHPFLKEGDITDIGFMSPLEVYEQSVMDLVVETFPRSIDNTESNIMLTEKTGKSIAHGRLFRTLGHNGYLGEFIRCGFEPLPIWRSDHDVGTQDDCWNSFIADVNEYSGNDFEMLYEECADQIEYNKNIYWQLVSNYPNQIHRHFELI